jgi:hypothetical protein
MEWAVPADDPLGGLQAGGVELGELGPSDLADLVAAELAMGRRRPGRPLPLGRPAALASRAEVGGVRG